MKPTPCTQFPAEEESLLTEARPSTPKLPTDAQICEASVARVDDVISMGSCISADQLMALGTANNLLNGTLGPSMLVLPLAFSRTGLALGAGSLFVIWFMSYVALLLLLDTCELTRTNSLVGLARAHGPRMSVAVDWSVVLYFYGTCIAYLILIGGTMSNVLHIMLGESTVDAESRSWLAVHGGDMLLTSFTLGVMLPLSCSRNLQKLSAFSSVVVILYLYILIVVWSSPAIEPLAGRHHHEHAVGHTHASNTQEKLLSFSTLRAVPLMAYCFSTQAIYPPALEELQQQTGGSSRRVMVRLLTDSTFGITLFMYLACGVGGYMSVSGTPPQNVLNAYVSTPQLLIAQGALVGALSLSFPVMFVVARVHIFSLARDLVETPADWTRTVTTILIVLSLVIAICFPSVESLLGLIGTTCSVSLSFVVPALLYRRLVGSVQPIEWGSRWMVTSLIGFGMIVASLSIPAQLSMLH
mmetsp:Transcript_52662/g.87508  ORF Transcript_52662/g.87508 Transcript_52662/m.87508 type:complete len:470 (+) Transcript_52662:70-1479(+)